LDGAGAALREQAGGEKYRRCEQRKSDFACHRESFPGPKRRPLLKSIVYRTDLRRIISKKCAGVFGWCMLGGLRGRHIYFASRFIPRFTPRFTPFMRLPNRRMRASSSVFSS
jgi:hypothetical protein